MAGLATQGSSEVEARVSLRYCVTQRRVDCVALECWAPFRLRVFTKLALSVSIGAGDT